VVALGPPRHRAHGGQDHQIRGLGKSSRTVCCRPYAGPTFHSCPPGIGVVQRLGSSIGRSRGGTALILDHPLIRPYISPVGPDGAGVMRWTTRSLHFICVATENRR
jgi:hypothetical protein